MTKKAEDVEVVVVDTVARADTPGTVSEIYVPPTIVNFDPNAEVKMPKRILTA